MSPPSWTGGVLNPDTVADAEKSAVALQTKLQEIDKLINAAPAGGIRRVAS